MLNLPEPSSPSEPSSVCALFSAASNLAEHVQRSGVFLSPNMVLTTYLNGKNLAQITFENNQGDAALSAHLEPVAKNKELGLAIVELTHPIGKKFASIPEGKYSHFIAGSLVTTFEGTAKRHPVIWDYRYDKFLVSQEKENSISMATSLSFSPENAGAPIFRLDGTTLATMVSDFRDVLDSTLNSLGVIDMHYWREGHEKIPNTFMATNPSFFHRWLQENATALNLV